MFNTLQKLNIREHYSCSVPSNESSNKRVTNKFQIVDEMKKQNMYVKKCCIISFFSYQKKKFQFYHQVPNLPEKEELLREFNGNLPGKSKRKIVNKMFTKWSILFLYLSTEGESIINKVQQHWFGQFFIKNLWVLSFPSTFSFYCPII